MEISKMNNKFNNLNEDIKEKENDHQIIIQSLEVNFMNQIESLKKKLNELHKENSEMKVSKTELKVNY